MENRIAFIFIFTLLLPTIDTLGQSTAPMPDQILSKVKKQGADKVVKELSRDTNKWESLLDSISSGRSKWVEVAVALAAGADAGKSTDLRTAMFLALRKAPAQVLKVAEPAYPIAILCLGRPDPLPTFEAAIDEVRATITAVEGIDEPAVSGKKQVCLQKLHESERDLKRFFGLERK